jgi:methyl-accepting chemotaxis protein
MSIARKLFLLVSIAAAGLVIVSVFAERQLHAVFEAANYANVNTVPSIEVLDDAVSGLTEVRVGVWRRAATTDPALGAAAEQMHAKGRGKMEKAFQDYERLVSDDRDKGFLASDLAAYKGAADAWDGAIKLAKAGKLNEAQAGLLANSQGNELLVRITEHRNYNAELGAAGAKIAQETITRAVLWLAIVSVIVLAGVLLLGFAISSGIKKPLDQVVAALDRVSQHDLTARVDIRSTDELGRMAKALNSSLESICRAFESVVERASLLGNASAELERVSGVVGDAAQSSSGKAQSVAVAAEQVSKNVNTVSVSAEEMNSTIQEVSRSTSTSAQVAQNAVQLANAASQVMANLDKSNAQVTEVVKLINSIAEQTNLLALNATIEAARAGEAGKGFAVVASEVKALAQQTAKATGEITGTVLKVQGDSRQAIESIAQVAKTIDEMNALQTSIASMVEEQAAATAEIGRNVTEGAKGSAQIAADISAVAEAARVATDGARDSSTSARQVAQIAGELREITAGFKVEQGARREPSGGFSFAQPQPLLGARA